MVEVDGVKSNWHDQQTGIRQGCPLSPYLFLIVMTTMFHDIHTESVAKKMENRLPNTNFDEVLYADDTICISKNAKVLQKILGLIETHGERYGLRLNKKKCELLSNGRTQIRFPDGTLVQWKEEVKYLGCTLNMKADTTREVRDRICTSAAILKNLDLFWR